MVNELALCELRFAEELDRVAVKNLALWEIVYVLAGKNFLRRVVPAFAVRQIGGVENLILAQQIDFVAKQSIVSRSLWNRKN